MFTTAQMMLVLKKAAKNLIHGRHKIESSLSLVVIAVVVIPPV